MIRLTETLWIGNSADEEHADLDAAKISAVLNVAQDLKGTRGWLDGIEYAQVGLIDGPGNTLSAYHAAVLALDVLLKRHKQVLVYCHSGGRALAVSLMLYHSITGYGWDGHLALLRERIDEELPVLHPAHRVAFDKMKWRLLASVVEE